MSIPDLLAHADWKIVAEVVGAAVGLATLLKGTLEYVKQGAQKRTELFLKMCEKYDDFREICDLLEHQDELEVKSKIRALSFARKQDFIGFHEELALMMESGLLRPAVVHYMFGYYAMACWKSDDFWNAPNGLNRDGAYWRLFRSFAEKMNKERKAFLVRAFNPKNYQM
jgi:hypothetical protein